jgi:hypothetical protein
MGNESTEKQALDWNPQGTRKKGRPKQTWIRTVLEKPRKCGKTWSKVKRLGHNKVRWKCFTNAPCS